MSISGFGGGAGTLPKASLREVNNESKQVVFHFNPNEIGFSRTAEYNASTNQGQRHPTVQFKGTGPTELTLSLLFDAAERQPGHSVLPEIEQLLTWTQPAPHETRSPRPPRLKFSWGSLVIGDSPAFIGVLKKVDVKYTLFTRDGLPIRANVTVLLAALPNETSPPGSVPQSETGHQNPTSGATSVSRTHVFAAGDSIQSLAFRYYADASLWRGLAQANGIDDPLRVTPGRTLCVPEAADLPRGG
jgi:Contractile injection system tube protein/LysM domain